MEQPSERKWDVVIVGARCAGAALATLLARAGVRTLLLDRSVRGSDMPMSTHLLQAPGMDVLDELGVGERVRAVTPASRAFRLALDQAEVIVPTEDGRHPFCVRRKTLDPWLQEAAEAAGAEFRDHHRVVELLRNGERVTGVVAETPAGRVRLHADLVVGADGPHSTVAKLTGAEEYLTLDGTRGGFWLYFPAPSRWPHAWDTTLEHRGEELRYVFRCDGDLVLLTAVTHQAVAASWGKDWRQKTREHLADSPTTAALSAGLEPVGTGCGLVQMRFFYRRPIGPGFALVGDAGHFKDVVTGQGMTDAFLDARRLSRAILDGREQAYEHFWRERDVETLPLHYDALRQGHIGFNTPLMRWNIELMRRRPELAQRALWAQERRLSPYDVLPLPTLVPWLLRGVLRGQIGFVRDFFAMGAAQANEQRELAARRVLLEQAGTRLAAAPRPERAPTVLTAA